MPKKAKTGRKSYPLTRALERRIMALAVKAVRADWAAESAKLNLRSVETPGSGAPSAPPATDGGYRLTEVGPLRRDFDPEVDRAEQAFGIAPTPDRSAIIRQMQRWRGDRQGYVNLACVCPNPEQMAEALTQAADHLTQTDPAGGGGQIAPPPSDPASPAAFDAAVAANKAIFSLREAAPFQKNNFGPEPLFYCGEHTYFSPPSDTTTDGTHSGETAPAKNEISWSVQGDYHDWSVAHEPAVATDELERAMLDDGMIEWAFAPRAPGSAPGFLGGLSPEQRAAVLATVRQDMPEAQVPICAGGVWLTASWSRGEVVCSVCGQSRLLHPPAAEKTDSPPANTHLGTLPGGRPLGPPKVNDPRTWWETIMADVEALPRGNQLTLSPWQVRHLYDALHAWGYRSGRRKS